jgi:predicted O-linked N-acetylglucosamine transferase (SPINDLY family)
VPSTVKKSALDLAMQGAVLFEHAGQLPEAEQLYRIILNVYPEHPDANHNFGLLMIHSGNHSAGLFHLDKALKINPSQGQFWLSFAHALLTAGQAIESIMVIQTAIDSGLDTPAAHALLKNSEAALANIGSTDIIALSKANETLMPTSDFSKATQQESQLNLLIELFNSGHFVVLEILARLIIEQQPECGVAWEALGLALQQQGKDALPALHKAAKLLPNEAEVHNNLGSALQNLGQPELAVASFQMALEINPDFVQAHFNLGNALRTIGNITQALKCYRRALQINPFYAEAFNNQGLALMNLGRLHESVQCYLDALEIKTDYAEAHNNLGNALGALGQYNAAVNSYHRALETRPDYTDAHYNLGSTLHHTGQLLAAVTSYRRVLDIDPDFTAAHNNLGIVLQTIGKLEDAVESYRRALQIQPDYAEAHNNLGNVLRIIGQTDAAVASYSCALKFKPDYAEAYNNLANVLQDQGKHNDAAANYHRALEIKPDYAEAHSNMLCSMQYSPGYTQAEIFAKHLAYAQCFELPLIKNGHAHADSLDPCKRLKIGYVSPDFRQHSVAYFIESVLAHHDRNNYEIYCYCNNSVYDQVTLRLKSLVEHWCDIKIMDDEEAAQQIKIDNIDILVDLAGHTAANRLLIFARKPAPLQVSWLGYPHTTGLSSVDYKISDSYADPVGMSEGYYSEKLYRLKATSTCYHPPHSSPEVGCLPAYRQGTITLGSFNNLTKVTPEVCELWAKLLLNIPGSRLMLKAKTLADLAIRHKLIEQFANYSIGQERLILASHDATHFEHMNRYNQIDIGLDPFPYNGTTTTFEATWMGVPVVSLNGNSYASRMGVSILTNLELTDLIANSPEDYIAVASRLAGDLSGLAELREGLRDRLKKSPLTNETQFTLDLEQAYREMWKTYVSKSNYFGFCS